MCAGRGRARAHPAATLLLLLLLLATLPALAGRAGWSEAGEVVSVLEQSADGAGGAGGPAFAPHQQTSVVAPVGHSATLDCRVVRLRDKSVSWVRSRDLQILSHAGAVFTADARVSAASVASAGAPSRHTLRIERLRSTDAGRYECQINTEPKMSLFYNLTVVDEPVPEVVVSVLGAARVAGARGAAATLACEARYSPPPRHLPLPPLDIHWQKADQPISLQRASEVGNRGAVALDTQRWAARVESRLTLAELSPADAGAYSCSSAGRAAALTLLVYDDGIDECAEAMQRDEAGRAGASGAGGAGGAAAAGRGGAALLALALALALARLRP